MLKEVGEEGGRGKKEKESLIESLLKWRGSSSHVFFYFRNGKLHTASLSSQ